MSDPDIHPRTTDDLENSPQPTAIEAARRPTTAQRRFAEHFLVGGPEGPPACASAAYRYAVGHDGRDSGTSGNAAKMLRSRGVQAELRRLRAENGVEPIIDAAQHVARLQRIYDAAMAAGNHAAACRAEVAVGQVMGFYTAKRLNVNVDAAETFDVVARMRQMFTQNPALRAVVAEVVADTADDASSAETPPPLQIPGGEGGAPQTAE